MTRIWLLLVVLAAVAACGAGSATPTTTTAAPSTAAPTPAAAAADDSAPLPYTAEQIRAASPVGRTLRFRMAQAGVVTIVEMTFTAADADGATVATTVRDEDGAALAPAQTAAATWAELAGHARAPAATTAIDDADVETPAGRFRSRRYVIRRPHTDGRPSVTTIHFTTDLAHAGPPVSMQVEIAGELAVEMTLLSDRAVPR